MYNFLEARTVDYNYHYWCGSRGRVKGVRTLPEVAYGFLIQLVFCGCVRMWFIGVSYAIS